MVPNTAVIGLPITGTVEKYDLMARSLAGVTPAADSSSLTDVSIIQANGVTTLSFIKPLVEEGEVSVGAGQNRFNWAIGFGNTLGTHMARGSIVANFPECIFPTLLTESPTTAPRTPAPVSTTSPLDCSFQDDLDLQGDGSLLLRRIVNQVDQTVTVQLEYAGEGWLGFAFSEEPIMIPNTAVIGLPDTGIVEKYDLTARALSGVTPTADSSSLTEVSITQGSGVTILTFTKPLVEEGEVAVVAGAENRFNWAVGFSNTLGQGTHMARGSTVASFDECLVVTPAPTEAPIPPPETAAPTEAPIPPPETAAPVVANITPAPTEAPVQPPVVANITSAPTEAPPVSSPVSPPSSPVVPPTAPPPTPVSPMDSPAVPPSVNTPNNAAVDQSPTDGGSDGAPTGCHYRGLFGRTSLDLCHCHRRCGGEIPQHAAAASFAFGVSSGEFFRISSNASGHTTGSSG